MVAVLAETKVALSMNAGVVPRGNERLGEAAQKLLERCHLRQSVDGLRVGWLKRGMSHNTKRCRGVSYPESYMAKYTTCTKINS